MAADTSGLVLAAVGALLLVASGAAWAGWFRSWIAPPPIAPPHGVITLLPVAGLGMVAGGLAVAAARPSSGSWLEWVASLVVAVSVPVVVALAALFVVGFARYPRRLLPPWMRREGLDFDRTEPLPAAGQVVPSALRAAVALPAGRGWWTYLVHAPHAERDVGATCRPGAVPGRLTVDDARLVFVDDARRASPGDGDRDAVVIEAAAVRGLRTVAVDRTTTGERMRRRVHAYPSWLGVGLRRDVVVDTAHGVVRFGPLRASRRRRLARALGVDRPERASDDGPRATT